MVNIEYVLVGIICITILSFILFQGRKEQKENERKICFDQLIDVVLIFCFVDIFWGLVISGSILSSSWIVFATTLFYVCAVGVAYDFFLFIFSYSKTTLQYRKLIFVIASFPLLFEIGILVYNFSSGVVFYVGADGSYKRGIESYVRALYIIHYIYFFMAFLVALYAYLKAKREKRDLSYSVVLFCVIPIVAGYLQLLYPNIPYYSVGYMLSCFTVFIFEVVKDRERFTREMLKHQQKDILEACSSVLYRNSIPEETIQTLIGLLANYYVADRTMLLELSEDRTGLCVKYEWHTQNCNSLIYEIESIPASVVIKLLDTCYREGEFYLNVNDKATIKSSFIKLFIEKNSVKNIQIIPIMAEGQIIGLLDIENSKEFLRDTTIAKTISFYIYSELLRQMRIEKEKVTSGAVIEALAVEYDSVFHIDVRTDILTPYRVDDHIRKLYGNNLNRKVKYADAYTKYINASITDEDEKLEMSDFCSEINLMNILKDRVYVTKKFKITTDRGYEYHEAKIVKIGGKDGVIHSVVIGIANIDEKLRERMIEEKIRDEHIQELESVKEEAETLMYESQFDKLTGIYNKISGTEIMQKYLSAKDVKSYYVLLFIDLDKFKYINDNFGHLEGDDILTKVGSVIKSNCRVGDIAVRFGGDEFLLMLKNISDISLAKKKADLIAAEIGRISYGKEYSSTCSIGGFVTNIDDLTVAMDKADKALYDVKNRGRDGIKIIADEVD